MPPPAQRRFDLVITDLDNTLYDWEAFFVPSFRAMLDEVRRISGLDSDELEASFRRVYQRHRTTEYAFAIEELDALGGVEPALSPEEVRVKYASAIHAFRETRDRTLQLYPGVRSTLESLHAAGVRLAAHSDSLMGYVSRRLRHLGVDSLFDAVSAPSDHGRPRYAVPQGEDAAMARTTHVEFSSALRKPDPATLEPLLRTLGIAPANAVYVGDNLSRDISLATAAGLSSVWARYGAIHDMDLRNQLLRITYWTETDVAAEARLRADIGLQRPTFEINSFEELTSIVLV